MTRRKPPVPPPDATGALRPPGTGASNASGHGGLPGPGAGERAAPGPLTAVFVIVGVRTSAGPGPGVRNLPAPEASALVAMKHAVYGDQPPRGWPG